MTDLELARKSGATWGNEADQLFMSESALAAFTEAVRQEERERAEQDARRLDWLERNVQRGIEFLPEGEHGAATKWLISIELSRPPDRHGAFFDEFGGDTLRAAIDAAIISRNEVKT